MVSQSAWSLLAMSVNSLANLFKCDARVGGGDFPRFAFDQLGLLEPLVRLRELDRLSVGGLQKVVWQSVSRRQRCVNGWKFDIHVLKGIEIPLHVRVPCEKLDWRSTWLGKLSLSDLVLCLQMWSKRWAICCMVQRMSVRAITQPRFLIFDHLSKVVILWTSVTDNDCRSVPCPQIWRRPRSSPWAPSCRRCRSRSWSRCSRSPPSRVAMPLRLPPPLSSPPFSLNLCWVLRSKKGIVVYTLVT